MEIKTTKEIMLTYNDNTTLEYKWVHVSDILEVLKRPKTTKEHIIDMLEGKVK